MLSQFILVICSCSNDVNSLLNFVTPSGFFTVDLYNLEKVDIGGKRCNAMMSEVIECLSFLFHILKSTCSSFSLRFD